MKSTLLALALVLSLIVAAALYLPRTSPPAASTPTPRPPAYPAVALPLIDVPENGYFNSARDINNHGEAVGNVSRSDGMRHATLWREGTIIDLPTSPRFLLNIESAANAINDAGQIVGWSGIGAATWTDGALAILATPFLSQCEATGINNKGDIVGTCTSLLGAINAVRWSQGTFVVLPALPGAGDTEAAAINDAGDIVGVSGDHAVLWTDGKATALPELPGARDSAALAINNRDEIVGRSGGQAVRWSNGAVSALKTLPGMRYSEARAINDLGQIVGVSSSNTSNKRAVAWLNGAVVALGDLPGSTSSSAEAINNAGTIVGAAVTAERGQTPAVWSIAPPGTPVPTSATPGLAATENGQP